MADRSRVGSWLWRLTPGRWQWRILWALNPKFNVGLAAVVRDGQGHVLVLRHAYRAHVEWGLPTGWMQSGETYEQAIAREVREETGLEIVVGRLLAVESGYRLRVELVFEASVDGTPVIGPLSGEVHEARFVAPQSLPDRLTTEHRRYVALTSSPSLVEEPAR